MAEIKRHRHKRLVLDATVSRSVSVREQQPEVQLTFTVWLAEDKTHWPFQCHRHLNLSLYLITCHPQALWDTQMRSHSQLPAEGNIFQMTETCTLLNREVENWWAMQHKTTGRLAEGEDMQEEEEEGQPKACEWTPVEGKETQWQKYTVGKAKWNHRVMGGVQYNQFNAFKTKESEV